MIIFFYGEDTYRLKEKLKALKEKFISSSLGDTNLAILDGKEAEFNEISRQVLAMPFLSKTRLVVIENLFGKGVSASGRTVQEKVGEFLKKVPESTVLVFAEEGNPDKRTSLFKKLSKLKMAQEFRMLEGNALKNWIKKEVEKTKAEISTEATEKLIEYVGADLWRLHNEIEKLAVYTNSQKITTSDVEKMVASQVESNIFSLVDEIGKKNLSLAAKELDKLEKDGVAEIYILAMIVRQYRNLLIIKDLIDRKGQLSSYQVAKETGLNPFVVQKTFYQAKNFSFFDLKKIYGELLNLDLKIKTGKIEKKVALNLFLAKFCS